ncbi:NADH-ubiquinone oxidoreductase chain 4L protein [Salinisphaera shabanensis E1L3A]|uniref:NADH-ubiquinone oxidoreductase chain 4L protein n=1 Tax=Salinisphaera shabanensis E1L3A TaxID=1033802 RepID=U2ENX3_9GAMM|nr:cation:proton antiporter subunit C [Salinisphaera shabanensis]ERJ19520.1 NADH-ubiquinone oxidoreductase chain 4L protein [Salinisphaera shabanensis E1L3A]
MSLASIADNFFGLFNYWVVIVLMMIGFYTVISHDNLVKKLIGLNLFQTAVFVFYISMGKISGSTAPILMSGEGSEDALYAHPLPHVLILTAIVVGVSTTALGLALVVRINEAYGSIEEDDVLEADFETQEEETEEEAERTARAEARQERESAQQDHDDGREEEDEADDDRETRS